MSVQDPMPTLLARRRAGAAVGGQLGGSDRDLAPVVPYFGLRSYTDGGEHYEGQVGAEATPAEFVAALIDCTREMARVLKPSGSIFLNLGDKYAGVADGRNNNGYGGGSIAATHSAPQISDRESARGGRFKVSFGDTPYKSLCMLPERYRIAAVDELGLIARAVIVWSKPNGLPESVTDRVRRSHEDWVHLTKAPRYFASVDEIREPHVWNRKINPEWDEKRAARAIGTEGRTDKQQFRQMNPLGKLPGSVWEIATQPLNVPAALDVDHFAAFPMEWPRRLILGWSPREVCTTCGTGRAPVAAKTMLPDAQGRTGPHGGDRTAAVPTASPRAMLNGQSVRSITGYACACPDTSAPSRPGVVLDPFGGTGTTALVAAMLGRRGISVDLSADYGRLAQWRAADPKERARAAGLDPDAVAKVHREIDGQGSLLDLLAAP